MTPALTAPASARCVYKAVVCTVCSRVYQNLAISSENYRTFPKVGPHYKKNACKFLLVLTTLYALTVEFCSKFSLRGVKKHRTVTWTRKLGAQFSQNRILVIIKHLASYKIRDFFTFASFSTAYTLTGALYGTDAKT